MLNTIACLLCLIILAGNGLTIKPDPIFKDQSIIYDDNGHAVGTIKPDPIFENQYRIYDEDGNPTGTFKKDPVVPDTWRFENEH